MAEQSETEAFKVAGGELVDTIKRIIEEGSASRIVLKHNNHTLAEIPLALGIGTTLIAPVLAMVGALGAALAECTIEVQRPPKKSGPQDSQAARG